MDTSFLLLDSARDKLRRETISTALFILNAERVKGSRGGAESAEIFYVIPANAGIHVTALFFLNGTRGKVSRGGAERAEIKLNVTSSLKIMILNLYLSQVKISYKLK